MATLRKPSTAAKTTYSFTVEDVLETARYLSSKELRAYQAKLTNTSRELMTPGQDLLVLPSMPFGWRHERLDAVYQL